MNAKIRKTRHNRSKVASLKTAEITELLNMQQLTNSKTN